MSLDGDSFSQLEPIYERYLVTGLFKCGYYEFDLGLGFIPLAEEETDRLTYGVKIRDRFRDQRVKEQINAEWEGRYTVASWRDFNRAFFRALRMEKVLMMVLIGLIFVVVGFNIYHSLRRSVRERYEEIGVLKTLGAPQRAIQHIFVVEGLLIGLLGGFVGMFMGLLISSNINQVFALVETVANFFVLIVQGLAAPLLQGQLEQFSFFSPSYFYISEVPSRVLLHEAVLIFLFALFSSTLAALMASRRIAGVHPAEVLRYE
jgi:lipoprotein-releasing system permease protein